MAMTRGKPRFGPAKKICGKSLRGEGRWDNFLAWAMKPMKPKKERSYEEHGYNNDGAEAPAGYVREKHQ
jgi:hypothetical protein